MAPFSWTPTFISCSRRLVGSVSTVWRPTKSASSKRPAPSSARAQLPDGYLNSYYQVVEPSERFANPAMGHELYCAGHLFQAAVAEARSLSAGASNALAGIGAAPSGQRHIGPVADRFAACLLEQLRRGLRLSPATPK